MARPSFCAPRPAALTTASTRMESSPACKQPAALHLRDPVDPGVERDHAAAVFKVAAQCVHVRMAVDDAGLRRMQGRDARKLRLHAARRRSLDHLDAFDAVDLRLLQDRAELLDLRLAGRDHQLAALLVRHAMRDAEVVKHPPPARAVIGALRAGRVVEAGVDDLTVARGDASTDGIGGFRHDHVVAVERRPARDRQPNHPCPNHQNLHAHIPRL